VALPNSRAHRPQVAAGVQNLSEMIHVGTRIGESGGNLVHPLDPLGKSSERGSFPKAWPLPLVGCVPTLMCTRG
jgi:hypothetical protein